MPSKAIAFGQMTPTPAQNPKRSAGLHAQTDERAEMEKALRREIQRRRRGDRVVQEQYQALSTTLELALRQPSRAQFVPALLWAIVRACDGLWATLWRVNEDGAGGWREASAFRLPEIEV